MTLRLSTGAEDEILDAVEVTTDQEEFFLRVVLNGLLLQGVCLLVVEIKRASKSGGDAGVIVERDIMHHITDPGGWDDRSIGQKQGVKMLRPQRNITLPVKKPLQLCDEFIEKV